jgi:phosphatidylserine decarboxylase
MTEIHVRDRASGKTFTEQVYGGGFLKLLYGNSLVARLLYYTLLPLLTHFTLFSRFYGWLQRRPASKKKVLPFIQKYGVDSSEFLDPPDSFDSFNAFFIRHLKPTARPIDQDPMEAILPADARFLFHQQIGDCSGFVVKGQKFELSTFLQDRPLAERYTNGSMVMARLCPTDYHRYHFPCDCVPSAPKLINGYLSSVNPIALKRNIDIFSENKRIVTTLKTQDFGTVIVVQVGATNVGSIHCTYRPEKPYCKGDEMGYFSFGGSSLILLFEEGKIIFDKDLQSPDNPFQEVRALMGQSMGRAPNSK